MNAKVLISVFAVLALFTSGIVLASDGTDAAVIEYEDPNYREPPEVPEESTWRHSFGSAEEPLSTSSPAITWVFGVENYDDDKQIYVAARNLSAALTDTRQGISNIGWYLPSSDTVSPSWITYTYDLKSITTTGSVTFTVHPAAQGDAKGVTHATYWYYFDVAYHGSSGDTHYPYLFVFDVYVDQSGSGEVLPSDDNNQFVLELDYRIGTGNVTFRKQVSTLVDNCKFTLPSTHPDNDGRTLLGFSTSASSDDIAVSVDDEVTIRIGDSNVSESVVDGNHVYIVTLYAVWSDFAGQGGGNGGDLDIPDPLRDLLELMSDPWVMLLTLMVVFGLAYLVRMRRLGGY